MGHFSDSSTLLLPETYTEGITAPEDADGVGIPPKVVKESPD
jgi:hypothetical protein